MKRDIKVLLAHVEKKLLKKLNERPSEETLDKLALLAGFQDWESFRKEIHEKREEEKWQTISRSTNLTAL